MESHQRKLLEQYIIGKDQNNPSLLETIYAKSAEVEFELNTDAIAFPSTIIGNISIAKTLSGDFNLKYEKVRTYYLSQNNSGPKNIKKQPWLVVMKEIGKDLTRIGTGYYNWTFGDENGNFKIVHHKIYIYTMLEINDNRSEQLRVIQAVLEYPWVERNVAAETLKSAENLSEIADFLIKMSR